MSIAIIPARGGSKRIPGKNIKKFCGRPMIAWPISVARESRLFERIIVSTDSQDIADIAKEWGAQVPFLRPEKLSDDFTPTAPVLLHALEVLAQDGIKPEHICCIYATAPFLTTEYLRQGLDEIRAHNAPGALGVTTFDFPVLRAFRQCENGSVAFYWPEYELTRSQDLPEFFHDAGQFYWLNVSCFLEQKRTIMPGSLPIFLPRERTLDIDTPEDWGMAELMGQRLLLEDNQ